MDDQAQMVDFPKNLAIADGLPQLAALGGGAHGLDTRAGHARDRLNRIPHRSPT